MDFSNKKSLWMLNDKKHAWESPEKQNKKKK